MCFRAPAFWYSNQMYCSIPMAAPVQFEPVQHILSFQLAEHAALLELLTCG